MNGAPPLDGMAGEQQHAQFVELEARLIHEYGSDRSTMVHRTVTEERDRLADARIQAFVLILVERQVRSRLDASEPRSATHPTTMNITTKYSTHQSRRRSSA
jgi:hypothetical protein